MKQGGRVRVQEIAQVDRKIAQCPLGHGWLTPTLTARGGQPCRRTCAGSGLLSHRRTQKSGVREEAEEEGAEG